MRSVGYALGVGLAFIPLLGIPVRFMFSDLSPLLSYGGTFALGMIVGGLAGSRDATRQQSRDTTS